MALRTLLVEDVVVGYAPAMRHVGIVLHGVVDFRDAKGLGELRRLLRRETAVDTGATDIDARLDLRGILLRAVGRIIGEIAAMKAGGRRDAAGR